MHKPHIALLTSVIDNRRASGTALVARRLVEQLARFTDRYEFTLVHHEPCDDPLYRAHHELRIPHLPVVDKQLVREGVFWAQHRLHQKPFDIFHYLHPRIWPSYLLTNARHIVVNALEGGHMLPENATGHDNGLFRFTSRHLHGRMDVLTACSDSGKREIIESYGVPAGRVHRIYLGVDDNYKPVPRHPRIERHLHERYGIADPYVLAVSRFDPHKNILRLLEAYRLFRERHPEMQLVLVGGAHTPHYSATVQEVIDTLNASKNSVIVVPFVETADMPLVYSYAKALVYPSLHEGFGLPVVEALACGTPVITSHNSSLPEVGGNHVLYVDPYRPLDIADALSRIAKDPSLGQELSSGGPGWAGQFSWTKMANETISLYDKIIRS